MVAIRFPEDNATVFGACESAIGMGMMIGPILGQVFYYFEFEGCFYGTGVLILVCGFITHCYMPDWLNRIQERSAAAEDHHNFSLNQDEKKEKESTISYLDILTNLRAFVVISSCVFASIFLMFNEPIISD